MTVIWEQVGPSREILCLLDVTWALNDVNTSIMNQQLENPYLIIYCVLLWDNFFVQEFEDRRVEEALQQKAIKDKGDGSSKSKIRHEPFSFEDGMIYAVPCWWLLVLYFWCLYAWSYLKI